METCNLTCTELLMKSDHKPKTRWDRPSLLGLYVMCCQLSPTAYGKLVINHICECNVNVILHLWWLFITQTAVTFNSGSINEKQSYSSDEFHLALVAPSGECLWGNGPVGAVCFWQPALCGSLLSGLNLVVAVLHDSLCVCHCCPAWQTVVCRIYRM